MEYTYHILNNLFKNIQVENFELIKTFPNKTTN